MTNMKQVILWVEANSPFSPTFQKKVLGSMRRLKKMPQYGGPLDQISADLASFDRMWSSGPVRKLPVGFKSKRQFSDWRSQVRSGLNMYSGKPLEIEVAAVLQDDWSLLRTEMLDAGFPAKKLISLDVLGSCARRDQVLPGSVTRMWLQQVIDAANTSGQARALQAAYKMVHKHIASNPASVAVPGCFDAKPLLKSRAQCIRSPFPEPLADEVESWMQGRIAGTKKGHLNKRKSACSPKRARHAVKGVSYVYTAMLKAGLISDEMHCGVADLSGPDLLEEVIERELNGDFPWRELRASTLFEYSSNWKLFVRHSGEDAEALTDIISEFSAFENVKRMSESRQAWCEDFLRDHHKQAAFFTLPSKLHLEAKAAMASYDTMSSHQKKVAIGTAVAACAAAIWTSLPLRISTLLQLTVGFENADVQIHGTKQALVLTTPPEIVKNGYSHRYIELTPKKGGHPRNIVRWFVEEVRPRILESHISPHLARTDRLFCGIGYQRLSSNWCDTTLEAGVPMTPHQVRHALATVMANLPGADFSVIAALLGDTEITVRKNYVFIDQIRRHIEGQKILAGIQGHMLMRGAV